MNGNQMTYSATATSPMTATEVMASQAFPPEERARWAQAQSAFLQPAIDRAVAILAKRGLPLPNSGAGPVNLGVLGHGADDPLLRLMRERDDALALAQRSVEHGEAALEEQRIAQARAYIAEGRVRELEQRLAAEDEAKRSEEDRSPTTDVDRVIDQLDKRLVPEPDRYRLRRHLDKAEEPDRSRAGQDRALGGAIGRKPTTYGLRVP